MEALLDMLHADGLITGSGAAILGIILFYNRRIIKMLEEDKVRLIKKIEVLEKAQHGANIPHE